MLRQVRRHISPPRHALQRTWQLLSERARLRTTPLERCLRNRANLGEYRSCSACGRRSRRCRRRGRRRMSGTTIYELNRVRSRDMSPRFATSPPLTTHPVIVSLAPSRLSLSAHQVMISWRPSELRRRPHSTAVHCRQHCREHSPLLRLNGRRLTHAMDPGRCSVALHGMVTQTRGCCMGMVTHLLLYRIQ